MNSATVQLIKLSQFHDGYEGDERNTLTDIEKDIKKARGAGKQLVMILPTFPLTSAQHVAVTSLAVAWSDAQFEVSLDLAALGFETPKKPVASEPMRPHPRKANWLSGALRRIEHVTIQAIVLSGLIAFGASYLGGKFPADPASHAPHDVQAAKMPCRLRIHLFDREILCVRY